MQNIAIFLEGEGGGVIKKTDINFIDIVSELPKEDKEAFPWLWSVDPYGFTTFNLYQVPHVVKELEKLGKLKNNLQPKIKELVKFMEQIEQHVYVKLIGD